MNKTKNHRSEGLFSRLSKTRKSMIKALDQPKRRKKERMFVVEGRKNVSDILSNGSFLPVWLVASERFLEEHREDILDTWGLHPDSVSVSTQSEMDECTSLSTSSEVLAVFRMPQLNPGQADGILEDGLYLALDGVQDPGNLGTILRTAHWFGIRKIFASVNTVDVYNPKTVQSTMGSLGQVEVIYTDIPALISNNTHIPAVGLQLQGENLFNADLPSSAIICMGSEGNGLSENVRTLLSNSYTIPPAHPVHHPESLNVAVATAITLAAFCR